MPTSEVADGETYDKRPPIVKIPDDSSPIPQKTPADRG